MISGGGDVDQGAAPAASGYVLEKDLGEGLIEVRLNRPEKLNALNEEMYADLACIFEEAQNRRDVRGVLLSAEGRGFCSGSDVGAMQGRDLSTARARLQRRHRMVQAVYRLEKPVVVALRGPTAGIGFSLAMACDFIVASRTTYFQQSFRNVGLVPDGGAAFFLAQRLGIGRAKDLVMTARRLGAEDALDWGLVSEVLADEEVDARALELARDLASGPSLMMGMAKKMLAAAATPSLDAMLEIESFAQGVARESEDHREGVDAFKQKRRPVFKGC